MMRIVLVTALVWIKAVACAQEMSSPGHQLFNHENGLLGTVYTMAQDANNFIWLGTNNGLYRFDGNEFTSFGRKKGIDSRTIIFLVPMNDSTLLAYGKEPSSLYRIDTRTGKFSARPIPVDQPVIQLTPSTGKVLVRELDKLYWLNWPERKEIIWQAPPKSFARPPQVFYRTFSLTAEDTLLFNRSGQPLDMFDYEGIRFYDVMGIADQEGCSWVHTTRGFYRIEDDSLRFFPLPWKGVPSIALHYCMDNKKRIWFTDVSGKLFRYATDRNQLVELSRNLGLENHQITCIYSDHEGNIWLGTGGKGLLFLPIGLVRNYSEADGLRGNEVTSISPLSENDFFITTNIGIHLFQGDTAFIHPTPETVKTLTPGSPFLEKAFCRPHFGYQVFNHQNRIFYSTNFVYRTNQKIRWLDREISFLSASFIDRLTDHTIAVGRWGKVAEYVLRNNKAICRKVLFGPIGKTYRLVLFQGQYWLAAAHGLYHIPFDFSKLQKVEMDKYLPHLPELLDFKDIITQGDSILWTATSQGVLRLQNGHWQHLRSPGMKVIDFRSLALDGKNRLWASSNRGLHLFEGNTSKVYGKEIGLWSEDVTKLHYEPSRNMLYVGTTRGLSTLSLDLLDRKDHGTHTTYIHSVVVNDSVLDPMATLTFRHHENNLVLNYRPEKFNGPGRVLYAYRLEGIHNTWNYTSSTQAHFLALEPADYHFQVKAKFPGALWGPVTSLDFTIVPPLWKTPFFIFGALFVFVLLVIGSTWLWIRRVRKAEFQKREHLLEANFLEQQAISSTMNPHFIFNSLNAIQYYVSALPHAPEEAIDYIGNFSRLIRDNMEAALQKEVSLDREIHRLDTYLRLEQERLEDKLEYTITIDPRIEDRTIQIPSMLLIPFAENAIWHGIMPSQRKGEIRVNLQLRDQWLEITIRDNGVGFRTGKPTSDHISRGIALSQKRLKLRSERNHMEIYTPAPEPGTVVKIFLDLSV